MINALLFTLGVILITLKLAGIVTFSWWLVLLPFLIVIGGFLLFFIIGLLALMFAGPRW